MQSNGIQYSTLPTIPYNTIHTIQYNAMQCNATARHETTQHNTTQHNTIMIQYNTTRHDTTQHNTTQSWYNTIRHDTTRHNTTQHNTTQHLSRELQSLFFLSHLYYLKRNPWSSWACPDGNRKSKKEVVQVLSVKSSLELGSLRFSWQPRWSKECKLRLWVLNEHRKV